MAANYQIPILVKSLKVIDLLSNSKEGMTFTEILENLDIPKTTLFRILQTLENQNWLQKKSDRYSIGYMFIHYGLIGLSSRDIRRISVPYLENLRLITNETAHLAVLSGKKSLILEVNESNKHIRPASPVGTLIDLYCSAHGKIFLAYKVNEGLGKFFEGMELKTKTANTITNLTLLEDEIRKIRKNGYAVDDMECFDDIRCLAAPVWGRDNEVVGAIGITATTQEFSRNMIPEVAKQVVSIAQMISREMGSI